MRKPFKIIALALLMTSFFGCKNDRFGMLDYYFPLEEITSNQVYMYEVDIENQDGKSKDTSYLNIGRIVDAKYYFLTVGSDFIAKDSAIIMLKDGQILLYQLFIFQDGKYIKGMEENQTIYPAKVLLNETYKTNHTFAGMKINNMNSTMSNSFETQVVEKTDSMVVVHMITRTNLQSLENKASHSFHETAVIVNTKGIGLTSWTNRGEDYFTDRKLVRLIDTEEWDILKRSNIRVTTSEVLSDSTNTVNEHEGHDHP